MSSGKLFLGILAGIAAGATLGILFAPEKGSTTRKKIMDKGEDFVEECKTKMEDLVTQLTDTFEKVKEEADELVAKTKEKCDEIKKEVDQAIA